MCGKIIPIGKCKINNNKEGGSSPFFSTILRVSLVDKRSKVQQMQSLAGTKRQCLMVGISRG